MSDARCSPPSMMCARRSNREACALGSGWLSGIPARQRRRTRCADTAALAALVIPKPTSKRLRATKAILGPRGHGQIARQKKEQKSEKDAGRMVSRTSIIDLKPGMTASRLRDRPDDGRAGFADMVVL